MSPYGTPKGLSKSPLDRVDFLDLTHGLAWKPDSEVIQEFKNFKVREHQSKNPNLSKEQLKELGGNRVRRRTCCCCSQPSGVVGRELHVLRGVSLL